MRRLAVTAAIILFALPGTAAAANGQRGVVLSVGGAGRQLQLVDASHNVHAYRLTGRSSGLVPGAVVSYQLVGNSISGIRVTGHVRQVSYFASVVKSSGNHLVLRLGDGRTVKFAATTTPKRRVRVKASAARQILAHAAEATTAGAPTVTINIVGLAQGATVLVTETVGADNSITISISLPSSGSGSGSGSGDGSGAGSGDGSGGGSGTTPSDKVVQGTVTEVGSATFDVQTANGSTLVFTIDPATLAGIGMSPCDTVFVGYHASGPALVADNVDDYGTSDQGVCSGSDGASDEIGPVTQIGDDSVTIATADQGSMTFAVDPFSGLTSGFLVGDVVDVTYSLDADGVTLDASDIEYVENDSIGLVTAVGPGSVTVTDQISGRTEVFSADPGEQMFAGVGVGDMVDVTYHQSSGQQVVDNVDDLTSDGTWNS
jgi:hypothetical protein